MQMQLVTHGLPETPPGEGHKLSFRKQPTSMQLSFTLWETHEFGERYGSLLWNKEHLTWDCAVKDTVTSATSQPKEGPPDRLQSALPSSPFCITCTLRMSEGPSESQYLQVSNITANSPSDSSEQKGCKWWQRYTHQKRTHSCMPDDPTGVSSRAVGVAFVVM